MEHFVRKITFDQKAKSFGFLIQTPNVPEFAEADGEAFDDLEKFRVDWWNKHVRGRSQPDVSVEAVQKACGLIATTLKAKSPKSLEKWLVKNKYEFNAGVEEWAAPYIKKGWPITAFKIDPDASVKDPATPKVMRLSFKTDKLFYPYRGFQTKQTSNNPPDRKLTLYVMANFTAHVKDENGRKLSQNFFGGIDMPESLVVKVAKRIGLAPSQLNGFFTMTKVTDSVPANERTSDIWVTRYNVRSSTGD